MGKKPKELPIQTRVPAELRAAVRHAAARDGRTVSGWIRQKLEIALAKAATPVDARLWCSGCEHKADRNDEMGILPNHSAVHYKKMNGVITGIPCRGTWCL